MQIDASSDNLKSHQGRMSDLHAGSISRFRWMNNHRDSALKLTLPLTPVLLFRAMHQSSARLT